MGKGQMPHADGGDISSIGASALDFSQILILGTLFFFFFLLLFFTDTNSDLPLGVVVTQLRQGSCVEGLCF